MATSRADVEKGGSSPRKAKQEPGKVPSPLYPQHEGEREWTPWLVPSILVANITVFTIAMYYNNCPAHNAKPGRDGQCVARFLHRFSFQPLRQNPLLGPSSATLVKMGALVWDKVVHGHQGWRLFSCMWMHAGVLHLVANMLSLLFIGLRLEQQFGYVRIGGIYLISGVGGSVLSSLFIRSAISVGASGALFGLLGAMLAELLSNWTIYTNKVAAVTTLLFVIAVNLVLGILPHVNNFAHIGGFLTGFLIGFVLLMRPHFGGMGRYRLPAGSPCTARKYLPYQWALMAVALALAVAGFAIGLAMVFRGANANSSCGWGHYLSCVPTASWSCAN
ncbi:Inactive rhomboid protein 1 [Triticum urartu]|uniref:RHOMBOID-like protein n=1 Tax=Triticum urartu TaxID=4572 RepID=M8AU89_TRIUA|nr:Inactive rhomboid protein 1 [Triticum urartu]